MPNRRTLFWVGGAAVLVAAVSLAVAVRANDALRIAIGLKLTSPPGSNASVAASRIISDIEPFDSIGFPIALSAIMVVVAVLLIGAFGSVWPVKRTGEQRGFEVIR